MHKAWARSSCPAAIRWPPRSRAQRPRAFELVHKASVAGMAGVVSVGAPTTLAVRLARERRPAPGGFVRDGSFNVYAGAERLAWLTKIGFGGRPVRVT